MTNQEIFDLMEMAITSEGSAKKHLHTAIRCAVMEKFRYGMVKSKRTIEVLDFNNKIHIVPAPNKKEKDLYRDGRKIAAIKEYKQRVLCDLIIAKRAIESVDIRPR